MPLWVLEGIDGCGKETQFTMLLARIGDLGLSVKGISFPVYESRTGKWVKAYLDGKFGNLHPHLAAFLFALDRWAHLPTIERSDLINRYAPSNFAHQSARLPEGKREGFVRLWSGIEYSLFGIPRPTLVVWFDAPVEVCFEMKRRQLEALGEEPDTHERDKLYQEEVRRQYERLFKEGERDRSWVRIDCAPEGKMLPKEEIHQLVWQIPQIRDEILERAILARCGRLPLTNGLGIVAEFSSHWERKYIEAAIDTLLARWMLERVEGTLLRTVERR